MTVSEHFSVGDKIKAAGYDEVVIFENPSYDGALLGVSTDGRAVYDYDRMVQSLMTSEDMTEEEAADFISYNTIRSLDYVEGAPVVVYGLDF